jgi:hypothetical protein
MFEILHSCISSPKTGLFHLTGQPNIQKGRIKVRDGIELTHLLGRYRRWVMKIENNCF